LDSLQNQAGEKVDFLINHGSRRDKLKILGNGVCAPVMASIMHSLVGGEPHNACSKPSALNSKVAVVTFGLAFEASKFEFSKGETLECRYARPFLLGGKEFLFVPKTLR